MPTYQYACTACSEELEAVQSFSDPALTECPACGGRLRKKFSAVGVVFKGSGFYKNDSRPAATSGDGAAKDGSSGGDGAGKADKGGDKTGDKSGAQGGDKRGDKAAAPAASAGSSGTSGSSSGSSSSAKTPAAKSA